MESLYYTLSRKKSLLISIFVLLIVGFAGLTCFVLAYPVSAIDIQISTAIQATRSDFLDQIMKLISWVGEVPRSVIMAALVAALFFGFGYRREALFTILTLTSGLISTIFKVAVSRPRPTPSLVRIIEHAKQQSFPSGHTLFYTIFFGFLILVMANCKKLPSILRIIVVVFSAFMIISIPVSRIYLGAHWFTDVFAALILGAITIFVFGYYYLKPGNK